MLSWAATIVVLVGPGTVSMTVEVVGATMTVTIPVSVSLDGVGEAWVVDDDSAAVRGAIIIGLSELVVSA